MPLQLKRIYTSPAATDGVRILVDRLWPRGLAREAAQVDQWLRELAPSDELRTWFAHDREKWAEFKRRYFAELAGQEPLLAQIRALAAKGTVTLLFAASDTECNNAVALQKYLAAKRRGGKTARS